MERKIGEGYTRVTGRANGDAEIRGGPGFSLAGGLLGELIKSLGLETRLKQQRAVSAWRDIVGPQLAAVTRVKQVKDGIVFVSCRSSAWSQELALHRAQILEKLNAAAGAKVITDIRFSARGFSGLDNRAADGDAGLSEDAADAHTLSEAELAAAEAVAQVSRCPDLHERIRRAVAAGKKLQAARKEAGWRECPVCGLNYPGREEVCPACRTY